MISDFLPKMKGTLPRGMNRKVGRAMHDYEMLADGDRILVAVSGGIDSLILSWLLLSWEKKAPISYRLQAIHVDMEGEGNIPGRVARAVSRVMESLGLPLVVLPAAWKPDIEHQEHAQLSKKDVCFQCARSRRTQLFAYAREHNFGKLALGHHRDDIIDTFFLNLTCAGNISTMRPKQELFSGHLSVIRPLAYCDKAEVSLLGEKLGLVAIETECPMAGHTRRQEVHELVQFIYKQIPDSKEHIFAALGNVRRDYLLLPSIKRP